MTESEIISQKNQELPVKGPAPAGSPAAAGAAEVFAQAQALARGIEALRQAQAEAAGLRLPAFSLLQTTAQAGPGGMTVSEAAARLKVRPQALPGVAGELEQAGLLSRRVDMADARARRLSATPAGLERLARAGALQERVLAAILAQVPHPSVAKLVLSRLEESVRLALPPEPEPEPGGGRESSPA